MNIIIVFTSPTHDEYTGRWECINNTQNKCEKEWANGECKLFIFNGKNDECNKYYDTTGWKLNILAQEIKKIVVANPNAEIVVLFHTSDDNDVKGLQVELGSPPMPIHQYSKARVFGLEIWREHIVKFCFENGRKIEAKFISLWNDLQKKSKESEPHNLRYEILSPLVALDLIQQAEGNNTLDENDNLTELKKDIQTAIKGLNKPVEKFYQGTIECGKFKDRLINLMNCDRDCEWKKYHEAVKYVAEKMEEQIAAIEP